MANDQNLKHITLANTDLIEQIQTDEEDEFYDNPDYLSRIGGESPGFGKRGGNAYLNVMSSKRKQKRVISKKTGENSNID